MKWTSLLASLVLGLAVCTPGYSFELLDRMLGSSGCGCESSCCETKCPKSRCDRGCGHSWFGGGGCNKGCNSCTTPTCTKAASPYQAPSCTKAASPYQAPTCAAKAASPYQAPACGMEPVQKGGCGCNDHCNRGCFLDRIFSCNKGCGGGCHVGKCDTGCNKGCGDRCNKGCGRGHRSGCNKSCGCTTPTCTKAASPYQAPSCGCDFGGRAGVIGGDVAPMPPAPVVDPSAFIPTQRRVVQASSSLVR